MNSELKTLFNEAATELTCLQKKVNVIDKEEYLKRIGTLSSTINQIKEQCVRLNTELEEADEMLSELRKAAVAAKKKK